MRQIQREAFSMLTTIMVILMMATVAAFVLGTSSKIIKETTSQFQREQAALYAKSYTEYAVMAVTANDSRVAGECLENIDATIGDPSEGNGYNIRIRIAYIGHNDWITECADTRELGTSTTENSPLNIIVDAYVEYKEADHPDIDNAPYTTYHKRTLQKI